MLGLGHGILTKLKILPAFEKFISSGDLDIQQALRQKNLKLQL